MKKDATSFQRFRKWMLCFRVCVLTMRIYGHVHPGTHSTAYIYTERIDAFKLWCWRRLLQVPWTARRANQSILKEINPEYWLEGLMLKLKLQYFGHMMRRADSLEKTLMLKKIEGRRRRAWLPGSSPGGSRVIRRWGDGVGVFGKIHI